MPEYRLGLASVSFRGNSPREILDAVKRVGLECIEWGSDVHAPCGNREALAEIARMQKEYGVECSSYGTYFKLGATPIGELGRYIESAKMLGTDILRLWCGTKSGAKYSDVERRELFSLCEQAASIAEKEKVTLCMESHRGSFTERPEDTLALMERIGSSSFRMYWQPFQWLSELENIAIATDISKYVCHIHVFNWKGDRKLSLADAVSEWRGYLGAFEAPGALLLEFMPDGRIDSLAAEAKALRKIVEK